RFTALPLFELLIYQRLWSTPLWRSLPVFIRKRVYNFAVVGYSGEAYLCLWGRRQQGLDERAVLLAVKDSNILSALASNALTVLLVGAMAYTGQLKEIASASPGVEIYFFAGAGLAGFLVAAVAYFRRQVLTAPPDDARFVLGIHFTRLLFVQTLLAAQYAVAIPGAPITAWLMFLAAQLVLDRIPLLPNKDLLFVGLGLAMSGLIDAREAAIAGVLIANSALLQVTNLALFAATSFHRHDLETAPTDDAKTDAKTDE
ncbi:MAG: hypothetical protein AAF527_11965, partial [Pseudomonadota bacterium]